jgi:hypothetical protein
MKTKLLKKARKRFHILKVTRFGKYDFEYIDTKDLTCPFYVLVDTHSSTYFLGAIQTYEGAFTELIKFVMTAYKDKATFKLETTKVYYIKKEKS